MRALAEKYITEEEYWALEEKSDVKHEYFDGEIFAMAGGSHEHAVLASNALIALGRQLRGKSCRPVGSDQHIKVEATGLQVYPDVTVFCAPARFDPKHKETLINPVVIIEVLSPSTAEYDCTVKLNHYKQIESLRDYLLVSQDRVLVTHYHRAEGGEWLHRSASPPDPSIALESIACSLPLAELYDGVEVAHS